MGNFQANFEVSYASNFYVSFSTYVKLYEYVMMGVILFLNISRNLLDPHSKNRHRGALRRRYVVILVLAVVFIVFLFAIGSRIINGPEDLGQAPFDAPFAAHRVGSN